MLGLWNQVKNINSSCLPEKGILITFCGGKEIFPIKKEPDGTAGRGRESVYVQVKPEGLLGKDNTRNCGQKLAFCIRGAF